MRRRLGTVLGMSVCALAACQVFIDFSEAPSGADAGATDAGDEGASCTPGDSTCDAQNCGSPGHDCAGGSCTASVCQPVVLASHLANPVHVALDEAHVYWADATAGTISSIPKTGAAAPSTVVTVHSGAPAPVSLAIAGDLLFWTDAASRSIASNFIDGGQAGPSLPVPDGGVPRSVAAYGAALFASVRPPGADGQTSVIRFDAVGAIPQVVATDPDVTHASDPELHLAVSRTQTAWITPNNAVFAVMTAAANCAGCVATLLFNGDAGSNRSGGPAVDDGSVYVSLLRTVYRFPIDGATPATIAAPVSTHVSDLAVDGQWVYMAAGGSMLVKAAIDGSGTAIVVASGQTMPHDLAVDSTAVYWLNGTGANGDGAVVKLAK